MMIKGMRTMTKEQMLAGFAVGRLLTQEEWADPDEIKWVDELIAEGKAIATVWQYVEGFQCERRVVCGS